MAILSFSMTRQEFLKGNKTVTRRKWSDRHFKMWESLWNRNKRIHDAWDNIPIAGGRKIGKFRLTAKPYRERLSDMPIEDLEAEGGMCSSLDDFYKYIGMSESDLVTVIRFEKL
ncbi:MAG: hypothetical protein ACQERI_10495 [Candidatus Krumholzibacteriota bacterium]